MATDSASKDYRAFGQLIRRRRRMSGLSQEALAAEALGNPDRKSFISAIENNRLNKITSNTAKKLSIPLGFKREDVPASLRWPSTSDPDPTEERLRALEVQQAERLEAIEDWAIVRFLNRKMAAILRYSMLEMYREWLVAGLDILRVWTGRPFSLQSLLVCYALSLLYVVATGMVSFLQGDVSIGTLNIFGTRGWANANISVVLPYLGILLLALAFGVCWFLVYPFGVRSLSKTETALRLGAMALTAGLACGVVDYLGTPSLTAAVLFTIPSCAAISTLPPKRAAFYGAGGGILFGLMAAVSSGGTDETAVAFLTSLSEGFIIGATLGSCACVVSSVIASRMAQLRPGQLSAAGGGVGVGSLISLAGILVASSFAAVSGGTPAVFSVFWLALPFANALLDFVSLGVSHALGRYVVSSNARGFSILMVLVLDLIVALALMVVTVVVIGLALKSINLGLGIEMLSKAFLETSASDPWGQGFWLTAMVLSTTTWTWLHFGLVVAPLAAGALTRWAMEERAEKKLSRASQNDDFDVSVGVLLVLRFICFYLCWGSIALFPIFLILTNPEFLGSVLWLGWRLTELVI